MRGDLLKNFQGCFLGKAVGDAVGFLVEGYDSVNAGIYVNDFIDALKVPSLPRGQFTFGQYSDDSQLARELCISLVEKNGFDPEDYANRIAQIFKSGKIVGGGRATGNSAKRLLDGIYWQEFAAVSVA